MIECKETMEHGSYVWECTMIDADPENPGTMHMLHQAPMPDAVHAGAFVAWHNLKHPHWKNGAA